MESLTTSQMNMAVYGSADLVAAYDVGELRAVEAVLLDRYRDEIAGRVLEVGCGGGRLTRHVLKHGGDVYGIDVSARMVDHCRHRFPAATFSRTDMRELADSSLGPFDVVIASFNVLDAVDHADRRRTLAGFRQVLAPGGLLIMSSHNLAHSPQVVGPMALLVTQLRSRQLKEAAGSALSFPRRVRNRRRLRKLETTGPGYAIVNDVAHDFSLLHYYVSPRSQVRQLATHGFAFVECLDPAGLPMDIDDPGSDCTEVHYVARAKLT